MQIFTVASYYGSGSSAITDFISEFEGVKSLTDYEFRFAHDPDGLSELEYNLVENFNRHNSGHALKRYRDLVNYYSNHFYAKRYEKFFNNQWKKLSYEYINSLVDFSYKGCWAYDFYDKGQWYEFWHRLPDRIMHKTFWRNKPDKHLFFENEITFASHPSVDKFLNCTKSYTTKLMQSANKENSPFLMVDQILPSTNIHRHLRYFENLKVFLVDRDPRDVYILEKYIWKDDVIPTDVELFCKWFLYTRDNRINKNINSNDIMFIQFEDLIYNYDVTTKKIIEWAGLKNQQHLLKNKYFDPKISIKNTKVWLNYPNENENIKYIEDTLSEYLYKY